MHVKATLKNAQKIAGVRVQDEAVVEPVKDAEFEYIPENALLWKWYAFSTAVQSATKLNTARAG